ncbi:MAG: hypothetical protein CVU44_21565 [Chloroflexi bacterium HGW-Chloroflexi-6]|nr:MAG: hypothetical protein CVU44_21565 [Chloroflexi bacterium HGW-Chloroflexi-6]
MPLDRNNPFNRGLLRRYPLTSAQNPYLRSGGLPAFEVDFADDVIDDVFNFGLINFSGGSFSELFDDRPRLRFD